MTDVIIYFFKYYTRWRWCKTLDTWYITLCDICRYVIRAQSPQCLFAHCVHRRCPGNITLRRGKIPKHARQINKHRRFNCTFMQMSTDTCFAYWHITLHLSQTRFRPVKDQDYYIFESLGTTLRRQMRSYDLT